jgi:hypothetical protein
MCEAGIELAAPFSGRLRALDIDDAAIVLRPNSVPWGPRSTSIAAISK